MLDYTVTTRYHQLVKEHERILNALKLKDIALLESTVFDHLHGALHILADRIETDFREYFVKPTV
jgi:DNA-binding GntR family transcriptional regulator